MRASKAAIITNSVLGHVFCIVGYFFAVMLTLALVTGFAGAYEERFDNEFVILSSFAIALCVIGIIIGTRKIRMVNRFRQYVSLISLQRITDIGDIAKRLAKPKDFVKKDMQTMIKKGFFVNAMIDMAAEMIIINPSVIPVQGGAVEYEVFRCPGCGASGSRIKGMLGYCDYCGSPVN